MAIKDFVNKTQELVAPAAETASKFLEEFNEALPTMRALGFSVKDLRIGMGLLPEIGAKLVADIEAIDPKKIEELIKKHEQRKTLAAVLKALQGAYNIKQMIGEVAFKGVQLDLTLGLPPRIAVDFLTTTPAIPLPATVPAAAESLVA